MMQRTQVLRNKRQIIRSERTYIIQNQEQDQDQAKERKKRGWTRTTKDKKTRLRTDKGSSRTREHKKTLQHRAAKFKAQVS